MRRLFTIGILAAAHLVLVIALALGEQSTGGFLGLFPERGHGTISTALEIIWLPLGPVVDSLDPGWRFLSWPLAVLNSLLWAVACYALFRITSKFLLRGSKRSVA